MDRAPWPQLARGPSGALLQALGGTTAVAGGDGWRPALVLLPAVVHAAAAASKRHHAGTAGGGRCYWPSVPRLPYLPPGPWLLLVRLPPCRCARSRAALLADLFPYCHLFHICCRCVRSRAALLAPIPPKSATGPRSGAWCSWAALALVRRGG